MDTRRFKTAKKNKKAHGTKFIDLAFQLSLSVRTKINVILNIISLSVAVEPFQSSLLRASSSIASTL